MYKFEDIRDVHLEITSKCQAKCPMCPRRINGGPMNPFIKLDDITLDRFKEWFPRQFIQQLNSMFMCGNLGDPIISRDTMQIFEHLREVNPRMKLSMHTNGSAREQNWWKELAKYRVIVTFGIDGLEAKPPTEDDPDIHRARPLDLTKLQYGTSYRLLKIREAFIEGKSLEEIYEITKIDPWFLNHIQRLSLMTVDDSIRKLNENGFCDSQIARYRNQSENSIREKRIKK